MIMIIGICGSMPFGMLIAQAVMECIYSLGGFNDFEIGMLAQNRSVLCLKWLCLRSAKNGFSD